MTTPGERGAAARSGADSKSDTAAGAVRPGGWILIVDDDRGPRESLRYLLTPAFDVITAPSVRDGLAAMATRRFDTILLDLRMPEIDGIAGLKMIRELDEEVSVIILTGYASWETAADAVRLGANDYLTKPYDVHLVKACIERHVLASRVRRQRLEQFATVSRLNQDLRAQLMTQQGLVALGQNANEMLHDLSNPLTVAYGYTQLLLRQLSEPSTPRSLPTDKLLQYLERTNQELLQCKDLADLWRTVGREQADNGPIDLRAVVQESLGLLNSQAARQDVRVILTVNGSPDGLVAWGSRPQFRRVFVNIVQNALQAVEPVTGRVEVTLSHTPTEVWGTVSDNGPGIQPVDLERIFQPYFSTKEQTADSPTGTGLGLYIVQKIVDTYNGRIQVESMVGEGTLFRVRLPRHLPATSPHP